MSLINSHQNGIVLKNQENIPSMRKTIKNQKRRR